MSASGTSTTESLSTSRSSSCCERSSAPGATVFRGIMSFGATAHVHTVKFLELSGDLPIVIECVDAAEKIETLLPDLDAMIVGGLITLEKVDVIVYRAASERS